MSAIQSKTTLIDNLVTSTWYDVRNSIVDNIFKITPFYSKMMESGKIKERVPDGTHFEIPLRTAKQDQNLQYFGRGDLFGLAEKESMTRLIYQTKNLGTSVVRYWDDERKNRGKAKILDYVDEIVANTKLALEDKLETDMLNSNSDPLAINSLEDLIVSTPTSGTLGGLARSGNTFLQNQTKDFTGLTTGNNLLDEMTSLYNKCSEYKGTGGSRTPEIILTTREIYQDYERICRAMQQIVTSDTIRASLGFGDLMFKNVEMFWAPGCPAGNMYFLNTAGLEMDYDPQAWFEMTEWKAVAGNSLDRTAQIVCVGQMCLANAAQQGLIYNITATTS